MLLPAESALHRAGTGTTWQVKSKGAGPIFCVSGKRESRRRLKDLKSRGLGVRGGLQAPSSRRARSSFSVSGLAGEPEEVELWSLPLLPSAEDKRTGHRDCEAGRTCALEMGST